MCSTRACRGRYGVAAMGLRGGGGGRLRVLGPVVLMPAAAFGVHQLRYYLAYGSAAGAMLARTGHSYLHSVVPWIVLLVAVAARRVPGGARPRRRWAAIPRPLYASRCWGCGWLAQRAWSRSSLTQEFLEGLFATGHPAGLAGIFGYGGWWSIPAALCIGLVLAALFHGALWVLDEVARRHARPRPHRRTRAAPTLSPVDVLLPRLAPLAEGCCRRGPPSLR